MKYVPLTDADNQHQILILLFRNSNRYPAPNSIVAAFAIKHELVEVGEDGQPNFDKSIDTETIATEKRDHAVRFPVLVRSLDTSGNTVKLNGIDFDKSEISLHDRMQTIDCRMIWASRYNAMQDTTYAFDDAYAIDLTDLPKMFEFVTEHMPFENCRILTRDSGLMEEYVLALSKKPGMAHVQDTILDDVLETNPIYKTWSAPQWVLDNPVIVVDDDCLVDVQDDVVRMLPYVHESLSVLYSMGIEIVIATSYAGPNYSKFTKWLEESKLPYTYVNLNSPARIRLLQGDPRHLSGDVYLSKKNLGGFPGWLTAMQLMFGITIEHLDTRNKTNEQTI